MSDPKDPLGRFTSLPGEMVPLVEVYLRAEDARLVKTALDDFAETFEDCDEEADRVAAARRVAAAIGEALR